MKRNARVRLAQGVWSAWLSAGCVAFLWGSLSQAQPARSTPQQIVVPPEVLVHVDALYPSEAMRQHRDGIVVLFVTVGADGSVEDVSIAQSAGQDFDQAAMSAVRQWKFSPAQRDGTAVKARIRVPFHFAPPSNLPAEPPTVAPPPQAASAEVKPKDRDVDTVEVPGVAGGVRVDDKQMHQGPKASAAAPSGPPGTGVQPTDVTILGRAQAPHRGVSDFHLELGKLQEVPRHNATAMLQLAPGILLTNEGGEGHAEQVFLRGFDAREGQDIEFSVGGVPINEAGNLHGNGHADLHFIIPELVESLRVLEGPFDPRQGNFAVAGSADYELGLSRRGLTAKYSRGSFNTERMLLLWGPPDQSKRTFGGAELYSTDGFGQNRDAKRASAMGQYEGAWGTQGSYRLTAQAYSASYHSAGVLREDDYDSGRKGFYDTYDFRQGGESSRYSVAGDVETRSHGITYKQQVFLILRDLRMRKNYTGFLLDPQQPYQNLHDQRGDDIDLNVSSWTIGARGSSRWQKTVEGLNQELELGYFARGDRGASTQLRVQASNGVPYHRDVDNQYQLGDIGLYADLGLRPLSWMQIRGGVRADLFSYNVLDNCAAQSVRQPSRENPPGDASCLDQQDLGRYRDPTQRASTANSAVLPRGSILLGPFGNVTFSFSYGQGARSIDPIYISQDARTPFARITSYEGGASYTGGIGESTQLVARSLFFQTKVEKDLVFNETAGRNTLANGTTRTGWVGALRLTGPWFDQSANITLVRSTFDDTHLLIPYVPDLVVRSDSAVRHELPLKILGKPVSGAAGLGVTYVGHRPLPYNERSDVIFTLDGSTTFSWREWELGIAASNLLDRRYRLGEYNYASDFQTEPQPTLVPMRHFSAGPPRTVLITVGLTVGGES